MKRLLILSYYFPPMGMGGVQRIIKFAKYLPQFGWQPEIITVKSVAYHAVDETLFDEICQIPIHRTESWDPLRLLHRFHHHTAPRTLKQSSGSHALKSLIRWIFIPDDKRFWIPFAIRKATALHGKTPFDALLTSSPPHSVHLAGLSIQKKTGLPWIADFRDGWWFEPHEKRPTSLHHQLNERMLKRVLSGCDRAVTISPHLCAQFQTLTDNEVHLLPNGFDPQDFPEKTDFIPNDFFTIRYCGTLSQTMHPQCFFNSLLAAIRRDSQLKNDLRIEWIGLCIDFDLKTELVNHQLEEISVIRGYMSHRETVQLMTQSDLLLFLLPENYGPGVVTGKLYEYLASGRPILAFARKGDASQIIEETDVGKVLLPDQIDLGAEQILSAYRQWKSGRIVLDARRFERIQKYSRIKQTEQLGSWLDQL